MKVTNAQLQSSPHLRDETILRIVCLALALYGCLLLIRGWTMRVPLESLRSPIDLAGQLIGGAKYDLGIVAFLLIPSLFSLRLLGHRDTARQIINICFLSAVLLTLVVAIVNVAFVNYLGGPLNYQWLYYSDFGMANDTYAAVASIITWKFMLGIPIGIAGMFTFSYILVLLVRSLRQKSALRRVAIVVIALLVGAAFQSSHSYWVSYNGDQGRIANPIIYFLHSLVTRSDAPLLSMDTSVSPDDFRIMAERSSIQSGDHPIKQMGIRNVLIFVLESVPARYVETYGGQFPVTPTIADRAIQSIRFQNIYAHAPNSHKSLVSILTSTYPLISYKTLTKEEPDSDLASMSGELRKLGYRTGFFYSADLRYGQDDHFLNHHSFDVIQDFRSIDCERKFDSDGYDAFLRYSADDSCTVRAAADWIDSPDSRPFFAIVWTNMTHFPYYAIAPEAAYSEQDDDFNRYLNALRYGDQALGSLLTSLENGGRFDSTLLLVTGDHGQAFGEHGQRGHGANLYQENVHIPLVIMNPGLEENESSEVVGGLIDIAPTVFDILGLPPSPLWQGTSLFAPERTPRTYFFATWTDLQFGYRDGSKKFIFNATANRCESFDLVSNPEEMVTNNRVGDIRCARIQERLAAWIQYQSRLTDKLTSASAIRHRNGTGGAAVLGN